MVAWLLRCGVALGVPIVFMVSGIMPRMRQVVRHKHWSLQVVVVAVAYTGVALAVMMPLAFYDEYLRARAVGLTERSALAWTLDWTVRAALTVGFVALLSPLAYLLIRMWRRRWWLWGGLAGGVLGFLLGMVFPIWVAPLLDRFHPMEDSTLRRDILAIAERAGVPAPDLFVVAKREETATVNAYVAGFGGTKRVVFWDTLIDALEPAELRFVAAHELAHDVLHHRWLLLGAGTALLIVGLWAVRALARRLSGWGRPNGPPADLADPGLLPLLVLAGTIVGFALLPVALATNRYVERAADRFALELTHDNRAAATTWIKLQGSNLTHPNPGVVHRVFRATHPPLAERIQFANRYRP